MTVSFALTAQQQELKKTMRAFAQRELTPLAEELRETLDPREAAFLVKPIQQKGVELGVLKRMIPAEFGGLGGSGVDSAIMWEELCTVLPDYMDAFAGALIALIPIYSHGTPEQAKRFLAPFLVDSGTPLGAMAFSEPTGTANFAAPPPAAGVQTTAVLDGDEWVINGEKEWAAYLGGWDGIGPDLMVIVCRTPVGISLIAAERKDFEAGGLTVVDIDDTFRRRTSSARKVRGYNSPTSRSRRAPRRSV
jgi:alkylation response protein AidB-like acyl-CoA dehydrogenase